MCISEVAKWVGWVTGQMGSSFMQAKTVVLSVGQNGLGWADPLNTPYNAKYDFKILQYYNVIYLFSKRKLKRYLCTRNTCRHDFQPAQPI